MTPGEFRIDTAQGDEAQLCYLACPSTGEAADGWTMEVNPFGAPEGPTLDQLMAAAQDHITQAVH